MKKAYRMIIAICFIFICLFKVDAKAQQSYTDWEGFVRHVEIDGKMGYKTWDGQNWGETLYYDYCDNPFPLTYDVTYNYEEAYKMIDIVNEVRRAAGVGELKTNDLLMQIAMERAAEASLYFAHSRPDGSDISAKHMFVDGENLHCGSLEAADANASLVESRGHYLQMIDDKWGYAGYGCVDGTWVQIFVPKGRNFYEVDGRPDRPIDLDAIPLTKKNSYKTTYTAAVSPKRIEMRRVKLTASYDDRGYWIEDNIKVGTKTDIKLVVSEKIKGQVAIWGGAEISSDQLTITPIKNCILQDGQLCFTKAGKATFKVELTACPELSLTTTVDVRECKKNDTLTTSSGIYKVTDTEKRSVTFVAGNKDAKKVKIPDTIQVNGGKYKVTSIAPNAFKDQKKLTDVTIGKNVNTIGKNVFYGCSRLKKLTIKTTILKSVGKNALKGIDRKAVIKVPKSRLTKYKQLFKGRGQKKTVQIKK